MPHPATHRPHGRDPIGISREERFTVGDLGSVDCMSITADLDGHILHGATVFAELTSGPPPPPGSSTDDQAGRSRGVQNQIPQIDLGQYHLVCITEP